jgi:predicted ester cyclase
MSPKKQIVRTFYDEVWNRGDKARIYDIFHQGFSFRGSLGPVLKGREAFGGYVDRVRKSLENYRCDILSLVEEGDHVVARMRFSGRHTGDFLGYAPTGKKVEWAGSAHFTFEAGKVRDLWVLGDVYGLTVLLESQKA